MGYGDGDNTWEHGNSLINYMKMADINGLTGRIKFDENGHRQDFELEIVELKKHGLDKVGVFRCDQHLNNIQTPVTMTLVVVIFPINV